MNIAIFAVSELTAVTGIPIYNELNDLHEATGSPLRTQNSAFHCFDMGEMDLTVQSLPAYRSDFFTLALSYDSESFAININGTAFGNLNRFLVCVAPGQVTSFEKEGQWKGYCTFFKTDFIHYKSELNFLDDFPFFNIQEINIFPVNEEQFTNLSLNYQQILYEQGSHSSYHGEVIRSSFLAVLWQVRRIYESIKDKRTSDKASLVIASKFQFLVNANFRKHILVEEYAEMLCITPNHLSQTIKEATGKTAKRIISQRRFEEATFLLKHTSNDIGAIAYHLNFSEPTHFNTFFKKQAGATPLAYRRLNT